jgi:hypothetical protein
VFRAFSIAFVGVQDCLFLKKFMLYFNKSKLIVALGIDDADALTAHNPYAVMIDCMIKPRDPVERD